MGWYEISTPDVDLRYPSRGIARNLVENLHRFDQSDQGPYLHQASHVNVWRSPRSRCIVPDACKRGPHVVRLRRAG